MSGYQNWPYVTSFKVQAPNREGTLYYTARATVQEGVALPTYYTGTFEARLVSVKIPPKVYTITGKVTGASGVLVTLKGGATDQTATVNSGSSYSFPVLEGGSYTVTPSKSGFTFTPRTATFSNVRANGKQDFTARVKTHTLSGTVSGADLVKVSLSTGGTVTQEQSVARSGGNYSFEVPEGGNYTLTPSKAGYTFVPPSAAFTSVTSSQTTNFAAARRQYTLSGKFSGTDGPVTLTLEGDLFSGQTTTTSDYRYSFQVPEGGTYTVTPSRAGFTFRPPNRQFAKVAGNVTGDFEAEIGSGPKANAGPDQSVQPGATVRLDGRASTVAAGRSVNYKWTAPNGITLSGPLSARPTFTAPQTPGSLSFSLVVSDGRTSSAPDTVIVAVLGVSNQPPVANAGVDQTVKVGTTVQLDGSGSSDADQDSLTYQWTAPAGVTLSRPTGPRPTFAASTAGTYRISLVVNDGKARSAADEVVVTVAPLLQVTDGKTLTATLPGGATMDFVWIEPGTFTMGDADLGDTPHPVTLTKGYYLGQYELTQGQWEAVMGTQPWSGQSYVQSDPRNPAVYISWDDMQEFVARLNAAAGASLYRLPTEAEWEYACRAGTTTLWSFGDDVSQLGDYAWYDDNAWRVGLQYGQPVGQKKANPWGLFDMHGNVWEWVQDWYRPYPRAAQTDPTGPPSGYGHVFRGGSVVNDARSARSAVRYALSPVRSTITPGGSSRIIGARLVRIK